MIKVEFEFNQKKRIIQCKKKTKLKKIFIKYAKEENLDINKLVFLNSARNYNTNQELKKTLEEILSEDDKKEGKILMYVNIFNDFDRTSSAINTNGYEDYSENSLDDPLILIHIEEKNNNYHMLLKLYLILFIKFLLIIIIFGICSFFNINNKYIINKKAIIALFITANLIVLIMSIILFFIPEEKRKSKIMIVFSILYILCLSCNCLLLSKYINYKIILIFLFIIIIGIFSIEMFIANFKCYNLFGFLFSPFIINVIYILLLHFFWIKNLYLTFVMSGFALFIILSNSIITYIFFDLYKDKNYQEYIFKSNIISLSIFYLIGKGIHSLYLYNIYKIENYDSKFITYLKIYFILSIEFIFIFLITFLCFHYQINTIFNKNSIVFLILLIIIIILSIIISFIIFSSFGKYIDFILFIIFTFCIIISLFLLSKYIDKKIILCFLILILSNVISIEIYIIFSCSDENYEKIFVLISFMVAVVTILFLCLFWIKDLNSIIYLSIFGLFLILLNYASHFLLLNFYTSDNVLFKVMLMNLSFLIILYRYYKYILSTFRDSEDIIIKKYFSLLNLFLFIQYIIILIFFLIISKLNSGTAFNLKETTEYYIVIFLFYFPFPFFVFSFSHCICCCKSKMSLYFNIFACILNTLIMTNFYIYLHNYFNALYLLLFFLIIILTIEIYALSFMQFKLYLLIIIPIIPLIIIFLFFYVWNISFIYSIIAPLFYIYLITLEINLSNAPDNYLGLDNCFFCNYKINFIRNVDGHYLEFNDVIYSIAFINVFKFTPASLVFPLLIIALLFDLFLNGYYIKSIKNIFFY